MTFTGRRAVTSFRHRAGAPPVAVFPLLCPVRESEWIPGWSAEVVYSESGVAEQGGIFVVGRGSPRESTFFVVRYDPPHAIEYLVLAAADAVADRLALTLEDDGTGGTHLEWHRTYTGLTPAGNERVAGLAAAFDQRVTTLAELLENHLRAH